MYNKTTLESGLRIITKNLENTQAVTVLVLVGAGSRYENKSINGIAHFLEHMFFKGAKKYKNTKEVSSAIDSIGGDFNAFTGKEYAGYYVKVASEHADIAMDVLSDMMLDAKFDPEEIDKERGVILEEYNMYQDTPMYQIGWDFEQLMFGDQPLGWDQIGTKEVINTVKQADFQDFKNKLYTPDNTIICVTGNVDHEEAVAKISKLFVLPEDKKALEFSPAEINNSGSRIKVTNKKTKQAHLVVGFPSVSYSSQDKWTSKVLATILGGNMSSRMFLSVREEQGLCYYVRTSTDQFSDTGTISTRAGVDITRVKDALIAIVKEYKEILENGVTAEEIEKAKAYLKGKMTLRLEDSEEFAHFLARQELLTSDIQLPEDINKQIESVTSEAIQNYLKQYFTTENLYMALIGPYADTKEFEEILKI
jgi:predicted Zn-dependent peptidase